MTRYNQITKLKFHWHYSEQFSFPFIKERRSQALTKKLLGEVACPKGLFNSASSNAQLFKTRAS